MIEVLRLNSFYLLPYKLTWTFRSFFICLKHRFESSYIHSTECKPTSRTRLARPQTLNIIGRDRETMSVYRARLSSFPSTGFHMLISPLLRTSKTKPPSDEILK